MQTQNRKPDFKTAQRTRLHATTRCVLEDGETTPDDLTLGWKGLKRASNQPAGLDLIGWGHAGSGSAGDTAYEGSALEGDSSQHHLPSIYVGKSGTTVLESSTFPARFLQIHCILNS